MVNEYIPYKVKILDIIKHTPKEWTFRVNRKCDEKVKQDLSDDFKDPELLAKLQMWDKVNFVFKRKFKEIM